MTTLSLTEWESTQIDAALARRLREFKDWFEVTAGFDGTFTVRPKNVIGVIPIDGVTIRIEPKLPIASIVTMLELVYDLPSLAFHDPVTPMGDVSGLVDKFALLFARRVLDRLRAGIYREYVSESDELMVVRGRIDVAGSIRAASASRPHLFCEYEELTADVVDNQILLAALHVLTRNRALTETTRQHLRLAHQMLGSDVSLVPVRPADCVNRHYDRLNLDYKPLHALARFFLMHAATELGAKHDSIPFTLNTAKLFETFVERWLAQNLPSNIRVDAQYHLRLTPDGKFESFVDLALLQGDTVIAVLDTKYKDAGKVANEDLYQVTAYAVALHCSAAYLIYPNHAAAVKAKFGDISVSSVSFDLSQPPSESGPAFLKTLLAASKVA